MVVSQGELDFGPDEFTWGGRRRGAGRPPRKKGRRVDRHGRVEFAARCPVHLVWKLEARLPRLRQRQELGVIRRALTAARGRFGLRVVHYSVQGDHLHMLVEAGGRESVVAGG